MLELLLSAALAQVQTVRLPPVEVQPVPAPAVPAAPVDRVAVDLLPDLVVKDLRTEGDKLLHVLVANEGTAALGREARISAVAEDGRPMGGSVAGLGIGESRWVTIENNDLSAFPLSKATRISVTLDPPDIGGFMGSDPAGSMIRSIGGAAPERCAGYGCVRELREDNNHFIAEGDAIGRGERG